LQEGPRPRAQLSFNHAPVQIEVQLGSLGCGLGLLDLPEQANHPGVTGCASVNCQLLHPQDPGDPIGICGELLLDQVSDAAGGPESHEGV
jgi:hypothetical protein